MKTSLYRRLIIILIAIIPVLAIQGYSQDYFENKESTRDMTKKEKKEARRAELAANYKAIDTLLQKKTFILEAEFLQGRYGDQVPVSSNINFISVQTPRVVLQTGSNNSFGPGYNGVGGVTTEGQISNYRVSSDDKRLNHTVMFTTTTNIGTYDVILRVSADASATATITGMTRGSLTYRGNLVAPYNSKVFKGRNSM